MFAALQGGQPIGEATFRLKEKGVVSPQVVAKPRDMVKAGEDADTVFGEFQTSLERFTGSMEKQVKWFSNTRIRRFPLEGVVPLGGTYERHAGHRAKKATADSTTPSLC